MSDKPELKPCPFRHIEKDYEHELSVIKDLEHHGLARVCCRCGYRSPVMGFDKESVIVAHNSLADLAKPSEWISVAKLSEAKSLLNELLTHNIITTSTLGQFLKGYRENDLHRRVNEFIASPSTRETP